MAGPFIISFGGFTGIASKVELKAQLDPIILTGIYSQSENQERVIKMFFDDAQGERAFDA